MWKQQKYTNLYQRKQNNLTDTIDTILFILAIFELCFLLLFSQLGDEQLFFQIYISTLITSIAGVLFLFNNLIRKNSKSLVMYTPFFVYIILFIAGIFVSCLLSPYKYGSILEFLKFFNAILITFILISTVKRTYSLIMSFLKSITIMGLISSVIGIFSFLSMVFFPSSQFSYFVIKHGFVLNNRVGSLMQYPNTYGAFLSISLLFLLYLITEKKLNTSKKIFGYLSSILILYSIYLTKSRGAIFISLIIGIILLLSFFKNKKRLLLNLGISAGGVLILIILSHTFVKLLPTFTPETNNLASQILKKNGTSIPARIQFAKDAIKMFFTKPIFGYGLRTFRYEMVKFRPFGGLYSILPHSSILMLLSETGIFSTFFFLLTIFSILVKSFPLAKKSSLFAVIYTATISLLLHTFVDIDFIYPLAVTITFILLGLLVNLSDNKGKKIYLPNKRFVSVVLLTIFAFLIVSISPKAISSVYGLSGNYKFNNGELINAAYSYISAIKHDFNNDIYHYRIASIYRELSFSKTLSCNNKITFKELKEAMTLNPINFNYPEMYGILKLALKNQESIAYFNKTIELNPTDPNIPALKSLAIVYTENNISDAKDLAETILRKNPNNSIALTTIGLCELPSPSSLSYFTKALKLDKYNSFAYLGKALYYKHINDKEKEVENLFKLTRISHCLKEGWTEYLQTAPIIKIDSYKISGSSLLLSWSVIKNKNLIKTFLIKIESQNGKILKTIQVDNATNKIEIKNFAFVRRNNVKISITALDNNNLPVSEIVSKYNPIQN